MSSTKPPRNKVDNNDTGDAEPEKKSPLREKYQLNKPKYQRNQKLMQSLKVKKVKKKIKMLQRKQKQHLFSSLRSFDLFSRNKILILLSHSLLKNLATAGRK